MKTFNEILSEIIHEDHVYEKETTIAPEERAAKEYAKQWVREALKNEPDSFIEYHLKEIDNQ